jgi:hypothetical protein
MTPVATNQTLAMCRGFCCIGCPTFLAGSPRRWLQAPVLHTGTSILRKASQVATSRVLPWISSRRPDDSARGQGAVTCGRAGINGQCDTAKCYAPPNCSIAEITGGIRAAARIKIPYRKAVNVLLIVTSLTMTNNLHAYRFCLSVRLVHIRRKASGYRRLGWPLQCQYVATRGCMTA